MTHISPEKIILKPVITEKALVDQANSKFHFWVGLNATKGQVAVAFKTVFGVTPLAVNIYKVKGKVKTDWKKRTPIQKSDRKRAIIKVAKDTKIELLSLNTNN